MTQTPTNSKDLNSRLSLASNNVNESNSCSNNKLAVGKFMLESMSNNLKASEKFKKAVKQSQNNPPKKKPEQSIRPSIHNQSLYVHTTNQNSCMSSTLNNSSDTSNFPMDEEEGELSPRTVEIKPLPKIRLSLLPSPREEDED